MVNSAKHVGGRPPAQLGRPEARGASAPSHKAINRQISRAAEVATERDNPAPLFDVIHVNLHKMNGINLATAFHRVAKLAPSGRERDLAAFKHHQVFQDLFDTVLSHLQHHSLRRAREGPEAHGQQVTLYSGDEMPVQSLSIVAWSCASLQIRHRSVFSMIADITAPRLQELKPYELSNLLWAFAKVGLSPAELFKAVVEPMLNRKVGEFKVQCLSTIAWSYATLKRRNRALFDSLAAELAANVKTMKLQEISNTLWAFAKNRYAHFDLFHALGDAAASDHAARSFKPQELSNSAWAFATVGLHHPALFAQIEAISVKRQQEMAPQNVANIMWAFAKLGLRPSKVFIEAMLNIPPAKLWYHKPSELSAVIWAAAQICPEHPEFFANAARTCTARAKEFSPNGLANLTKCLCLVQSGAPGSFAELLREASLRIHEFEPRALVSLSQGIATAADNPSYSSVLGCLREAQSQTTEHILSRIKDFDVADLRELSTALEGSAGSLSATAMQEALVQETAARQELNAAAPGRSTKKRQQSVESLSTSAEESNDEDDCEDAAWPQCAAEEAQKNFQQPISFQASLSLGSSSSTGSAGSSKGSPKQQASRSRKPSAWNQEKDAKLPIREEARQETEAFLPPQAYFSVPAKLPFAGPRDQPPVRELNGLLPPTAAPGQVPAYVPQPRRLDWCSEPMKVTPLTDLSVPAPVGLQALYEHDFRRSLSIW